MADVAQLLQDAMARHRAGDVAGAAASYEAILVREPRHFDALYLRGVCALQAADPARAVEWLTRAVEVHPEAHPAQSQLAAALCGLGRTAEAEAHWQRAIGLAPEYPPAREGYATLLHGQGRLSESAEQFAALAHLTPQSVAAHNNLGLTLWRLARYGDALAAWTRALALDPRHPDALFNAAQAEERVGRTEDALAHTRMLLAQEPRTPVPYYHAGLLFHAQGLRDDALRAFDGALARDPEFAEARWMRAIAQLQLAYGPGEFPDGDRARFDAAVRDLDAWFTGARTAQADRALSTRQPFYLAYHDTDITASLSAYGDLCARLMRERHGEPALPPRLRTGKPVRVAIVSAYFRDHSVWTAFLRGWCAHLDRAKVELHLFHTGSEHDAETALAKARCASFTAGLADTAAWIAALRACAPEVIVYPEVVMDATSLRLASLRLAPVQAVTWGHPQTSGLPTIDYFLSAADFEPPDGQAHYRERLVRLPGIGCYYEPLSPQELAGNGALAIDGSGPRFACVGSPYKYLPRDDHLLVDIARRLGACTFLFFVDVAPLLSRKVEQRLAASFAQRGLDAAKFVRFLPRQSRPAFFALLRTCDAYLDTRGFSGFNTAMQAITCDLPVVTCEGRFMRGRFASGILRRLDLADLVAPDGQAYVGIAERLARDPAHREDVRRRLAAGRPALFRDTGPLRALEDWLLGAAGGSPPSA